MRFLKKIQKSLGGVALILLVVAFWLVMRAPVDFQQGNAVWILYVHVPSAKMSLLFYLILVASGIVYLWKNNEVANIITEAAAPVGAAFAVVTLLSGAIWGKPMWGAWWTWDARLTSMLILLILYVGLMALRGAIDNPQKAGRATAVLAIIGAVDLPVIHFSVTWWRTLHQPASFAGAAKPAIATPMLTPLLMMSIAFLVMGLYLLTVKTHLLSLQKQLDAMEEEQFSHA